MPEDTLITAADTTEAVSGAQAGSQEGDAAVTTEAKPEGEKAAATDAAATQGQEGQKQDDASKQGDKPAAPEKYELKAPEGFDASRLEQITSFAKELGLTNEAAQKLLDREAKSDTDRHEAAQQQLQQLRTRWVDDVKADKELGGEHFDVTVKQAQKAITKYGTDEFKKALNESGYGNHPEVVRVFARIGKAMAEDKFETNGSDASGKKSVEDLFYSESTSKS
ncbi:hypothetical protein M8A51_23520 [Schlegelella sp. S2-27]|uniref:Protease n=1 Tax=Caldimonas mangrovi TaxID=2944811 RepID=A0ABT0YUT6_9BURK|nr:hypothetical protein [Caldimonas mangrovi]MCM5682510.1 hypothetical protein [Caldimonas mangrovi]